MSRVLFIGEFGVPDDPKKPETREKVKNDFNNLLNIIVDQKVPISAVWNFGMRNEKAWDIHPERTTRGYQLELIRDANTKIRQEMGY